jgi:hypothetical protein
MPACNRRAKPGHAAGSATRISLVVLQATFAAKVRRQRACSAPSVPAARSTAVVFGGRLLARLRLLRTWCALFGIAVGRGRGFVCRATSIGMSHVSLAVRAILHVAHRFDAHALSFGWCLCTAGTAARQEVETRPSECSVVRVAVVSLIWCSKARSTNSIATYISRREHCQPTCACQVDDEPKKKKPKLEVDDTSHLQVRRRSLSYGPCVGVGWSRERIGSSAVHQFLCSTSNSGSYCYVGI